MTNTKSSYSENPHNGIETREIEQLPALICHLYQIVEHLEVQFPGRRFTLDGHLVGSLGEVLAADRYGLELCKNSTQVHDAVTSKGKRVQIKATQSNSVALRNRPDCLIVLLIKRDGTVEEVYNGPGNQPWDQAGRIQKNGQRSISVSKLQSLMKKVKEEDRIPTSTK